MATQYTVKAVGATYRVKDQLKGWDFRWEFGQWQRHHATMGEVALFKSLVSGGEWEGVDLEVIEEKQ